MLLYDFSMKTWGTWFWLYRPKCFFVSTGIQRKEKVYVFLVSTHFQLLLQHLPIANFDLALTYLQA